MFEEFYIGWRKSRIETLTNILGGTSWFKNKTILELACGYGHIGKELQEYGAKVTFVDGNKQNIDNILINAGHDDVHLIDLDKPWNLNRKFDLVIFWGILYHLNDWKTSMLTALEHGNITTIETEVGFSEEINFDLKVNEYWYEGAINGIGSRPSAANIENVLYENNYKFNRYDLESLNFAYHTYSWKLEEMNKNAWRHGYRRFWVINKGT